MAETPQPLPGLDDLLTSQDPPSTNIPAADQWLGSVLFGFTDSQAEVFSQAWTHAEKHYQQAEDREIFLAAALRTLLGELTAVKAHKSEQATARAAHLARLSRNGCFFTTVASGQATAYRIAQQTGLALPTISHALKKTRTSQER